MEVRFETFQSMFDSWEELFSQAAAFAARIGPERLISISHSQEGSVGVATV